MAADINYQMLAEHAVDHAARCGIQLDFSLESAAAVDTILDAYYTHLSSYNSPEGEATLWNIAFHFGGYLGELLLRVQLREQGFDWHTEEGKTIPLLQNTDHMQISPITKAYKRIHNGPSDSVSCFCEVALRVANGDVPTTNVYRVIDVILPDGSGFGNVLQHEIGSLVDNLAAGKWESLVLRTQDGVLRLTGFGSQFLMEFVMGKQHYALIDPEQADATSRGRLITPFGMKTPLKRELLSRELVQHIVQAYYASINSDTFLKSVSTTQTEWKL